MKYPRYSKEQDNRCKLYNKDIKEIRKLYFIEKYTIAKIAPIYKVSKSAIYYWIISDEQRKKLGKRKRILCTPNSKEYFRNAAQNYYKRKKVIQRNIFSKYRIFNSNNFKKNNPEKISKYRKISRNKHQEYNKIYRKKYYLTHLDYFKKYRKKIKGIKK